MIPGLNADSGPQTVFAGRSGGLDDQEHSYALHHVHPRL